MRPVVVDASVAVKWMIEEDGTDLALSLFRCRLHAPDLLLLECGNVLWRKQRRREISPAQVDEAADQLTSADVTLYSARPLLGQALKIAVTLDHPIYDCVYLALAQSLACPMVTADDTLCNKFQASFPVRVVRLRDSEAALA